MKDYYAARAAKYEAVYQRPERQEDIDWIRGRLRATFAGQSVLEVACGTGFWTETLARAASSVLATDALEEPLEVARAKGLPTSVSFRQHDAYALAELDQRFSAAFAGLWFSHVPSERWRDFIDAFCDRVVPGGRFVLIDNSARQLGDFPIGRTDENGNGYQERVAPDGTVHWVLKNFPDEKALRHAFAHRAKTTHFVERPNFWWFEGVL